MDFLILYVYHQTPQVVHGIPNNNVLIDGDILSVDCVVLMNGYYGAFCF